MREFLRTVSLGWAAMSLLAWLALGPNLGWTKTSVTTWQKDPVTELEGPVVAKRFIPGVELLALSLLSAVVLFASSLLKRKTRNNQVSTMKNKTIGLFLLCPTALGWAAPIEFDFKDPKGVNNIIFKTDAPLESINGTATAISGKVTFDPANPDQIKGKILVATSSLHVGNPTMKGHLHSDAWMDVARYPDITFEVLKATNVKADGDATTADVAGKLTIKGVTKEITVPVKLTYLKDKLKARSGKEGDLLVLRASFTIKRSDYGINAAKFEEKVSNDVELSLSLAGSAPRG